MAIRCYIGLGSNLGKREAHLRAAITYLASYEPMRLITCSRVVVTPAMLPENAPTAWDMPYLNQVIAIDTDLEPFELLAALKRCEMHLGRKDRGKWGPREIDCDLLLYGTDVITHEQLQVPHVGLLQRDFVLVPLAEIASELVVPGSYMTVREALGALSKKECTLHVPVPQIMGILNMTPDSFSDGGNFNNINGLERVEALIHQGADIIDIGGESTRPNARTISDEEEWSRLANILERLDTKRAYSISVDTYHVSTAKKALALGVDCINDVSNMADPYMLKAVVDSDADYIVMHSLSIPANPKKVIEAFDPTQVIIDWARTSIQYAKAGGLATSRLILDPGIGFGKTALQSLDILMHMQEIMKAVPEARWMVGHSRKSFMTLLGRAEPLRRDDMTLALSAVLVEAGVDIVRVHEVAAHKRLFDAWRQYECR